MEAPKVKLDYSDAVEKAVKQIAGLQGKKRKIDTAYEYEQLARLLADVQAGKLDKNFVKNDELYIKGLQLEYQQRYLGEENTMSGGSEPEQQNNTNVKSEDKKPNPQAQQKIEPESKKGRKNGEVPVSVESAEEMTPRPVQPKFKPNPLFPWRKKRVQSENSGEKTNLGSKEYNNVGREGVIVSGDNNNISIATGAAGAVGAAGTEAATAVGHAENNGEEKPILDASRKNYTAAFAEGRQVAKDLIGYTTTEEKQNAVRYIMKQSPATIMGFISGFNENDTVMGIKYGKGGLIDQIDNEYGWTQAEKQETFKKIISTTLDWAKQAGFENDLNYESLSIVLGNLKLLDEFGTDSSPLIKEIDTEQADMLIKELVTKGMAKAGI